MTWKQWEVAICNRLGLLPARTKPGVRGPDCEICNQVGALVVDAKYWRRFPEYIKKAHRKTCGYSRPDQLPITIFRDGPEGDALVLLTLRDFERFFLPCLAARQQRGWW